MVQVDRIKNETIDLQTRLALRPKEAAALLGVSERTLRKWMRDEGLPYFQIDRGILIPTAELNRWMHARLQSQHTVDETVDEILNDL